MSKINYLKKCEEFQQFVLLNHRLPRIWEARFTDGGDMKLWFNKVTKIETFKEFHLAISELLSKFNCKILDDSERENEFLNYLFTYRQIPLYGQSYFSDGNDMNAWFTSYRKDNSSFETTVHDSLDEYKKLDLVEIWFFIKKEFVNIIKQLRRIPNHGEFILQNGVDVRVVYDKLKTFDPEIAEKILLHLQTYNSKALSINDRVKELLECVSSIGYLPFLQEYRFSDGTDMFTWYDRYKKILPNLESQVNEIIEDYSLNKKVNVYLIPNYQTRGGNFYIICTSEGELLDLSQITSFEAAKELDSSLVKRGGVILKRDEEIGSVNFVKKKRNKKI